MEKNSEEQIHKIYEASKKVYLNELSISEATQIISGTGFNESSARDYIYAYSKLRDGKLYTRTINAYATDYYLNRIYLENHQTGLKKALLALYQHIEYYEQTSGAAVKKGREIYNRYFSLLEDNFAETVFPDEVDNEMKYSEGKTKQILVNSYERNPIARQECIEYFGLNCQICNFNFEEKFGELGRSFIHVHHIVDIATIGKEYSVNPKTDLIPVCPNCHAMLHKKKPAYSIEELKKIMN